MIHIIDGNTKIGKTANISFPPGIGCGLASTHCNDSCYANKFYRMYPEVKKAWDDNFTEYDKDRENYFKQIRRYLLRRQPKYFRWHIAGDIQNQWYLNQMKILARDYWFVNFLAFTKQYTLTFDDLPGNLSIVLSAWPGLDLPDVDLPIAFIDDDPRHSHFNCLTCPESCEGCRACWFLKAQNKNVLLSMKRS